MNASLGFKRDGSITALDFKTVLDGGGYGSYGGGNGSSAWGGGGTAVQALGSVKRESERLRIEHALLHGLAVPFHDPGRHRDAFPGPGGLQVIVFAAGGGHGPVQPPVAVQVQSE